MIINQKRRKCPFKKKKERERNRKKKEKKKRKRKKTKKKKEKKTHTLQKNSEIFLSLLNTDDKLAGLDHTLKLPLLKCLALIFLVSG